MTRTKRLNLILSIIFISVLITLSLSMIFSSSVTYADGEILDYLEENVEGLTVSIVNTVPTITLNQDINQTIKVKDSIGSITLNLNNHSINAKEGKSAIQIVEGGTSTDLVLTINKGTLNGGDSTSTIGGCGISSMSLKCITLNFDNVTINAGDSTDNLAGTGIKGNFKVNGKVLTIFAGKSSSNNGGDGINVLDDVSLQGGLVSGGEGINGGTAIKSDKSITTRYTNVAGGNGLNGNGGNAIDANSVDILEGRINYSSGLSKGGNGNGGIGVKATTTIKAELVDIYGGSGFGTGNGGEALYAGATMNLEQVKAYGGNGGAQGNGGNAIFAEKHIDASNCTIEGGKGIIGGLAISTNETLTAIGGTAKGGDSEEGNDGANGIQAVGNVEIEALSVQGGTGGNNANGGIGIKSDGDVTVEGYNNDSYVISGGQGGAQGDGGIAIVCSNATIIKNTVVGGQGGAGENSTDSTNGGQGGNGGVAISSTTTTLDTANVTGGQGGQGGSSISGNGGNGGNGAEAIVGLKNVVDSNVKGGNGGNGGNTDGSDVNGGQGGVAATDGENGKKGLNKGEQLDEYVETFRGILQFAQSTNYTNETNTLINDTYVELQGWLCRHYLTLQENIDLVDNYIATQYGKIYKSIKDEELNKINNFKNRVSIDITSILSETVISINDVVVEDEDGYVLFSEVYFECEEIALNSYKEVLKVKSNSLISNIDEIKTLVGNGLSLIDNKPYDNTKSLDEQLDDLDDIYDATRKCYLASIYVDDLIKFYINSGIYIDNSITKLNSIYDEFKIEVKGIDPVTCVIDVETFKTYYIDKLNNVTINRIKTGDIDLSDIDGSDSYNGKFNGTFWGYLENPNGLDSTSVISIDKINRSDVNKSVNKLVKGDLIVAGKDSNLCCELKSYIKNKDVKAVFSIDLYEHDVKVVKDVWNDGLYKVSILLTDEYSSLDGLQIASIEDGKLVIYNTSRNGNYLEFYTTHFSEYILMGNKVVDLTWLIVVLSLVILIELIILIWAIYNKIKYTKYVNYKNVTFSVAPIAIMGVTLIPATSLTICIILAVDAAILLIGILLIKYNIINIYNIVQNIKLSKYKEEEFTYETWIVEIAENNEKETEFEGKIVLNKEKRGKKNKKNKIKIIN